MSDSRVSMSLTPGLREREKEARNGLANVFCATGSMKSLRLYVIQSCQDGDVVERERWKG